MTENIRNFRLRRQIPAQEVVKVIRGLYPKFDKTLQSKCEHDDEYGVTVTPAAMQLVVSKFAPELLHARRIDGHRVDMPHILPP